MFRYTIRRCLWGIVVLFTLLLITFILFGPVLQGQKGVSAANTICGDKCTPEKVEAITHYLGLDKPWYIQFEHYVKRLVFGPSDADYAALCPKNSDGTYQDKQECVGHLGQSFKDQRSVDQIIKETFPVTLSLTICAAIVWLTLAFAVGILSALRRGSVFDRSSMIFVLWGQALPVYYFGLLALWLLAYLPNSQTFQNWFGFTVSIFPIGGYAPFSITNPWPWAHHMMLPAFVLALQFAALYTRMIRSNMIGAMGEDYIRTARAKGVPPKRVVRKHAVRNVLLPIVTMAGLDIGILLGGAILTEYTFGMPGMGRRAITGVQNLDVPLTSGIIFVAGVAIVVSSIVVDLVYAVLDPRIRLS
jgi:peptide/nickel transport system permease protein